MTGTKTDKTNGLDTVGEVCNREQIRRIMTAVNVIDGAYDRIAQKIGLKENTLTLFYALDDGEAHSQKEICDHWLIPKTTLNTIVRECVADGYVILRHEEHRKEKKICLTEQGRAYAGEVLHRVYELERRAMEQTLLQVSPEFVESLWLFTRNLKEEARKYYDENDKSEATV